MEEEKIGAEVERCDVWAASVVERYVVHRTCTVVYRRHVVVFRWMVWAIRCTSGDDADAPCCARAAMGLRRGRTSAIRNNLLSICGSCFLSWYAVCRGSIFGWSRRDTK